MKIVSFFYSFRYKSIVTLVNDSVLWCTWVAHSVKQLTLAQVIISWFVGLSPTSGIALTVQRLLGILIYLSILISLPLPNLHTLSLSQNK